MFAGIKVLIVEDEPLIAMGIEQIARSAGASETVVVADLVEADRHIDEWQQFALAFIPPPRTPQDLAIAQGLRDGQIALVIVTASASYAAGVEGLHGVPVVVKPFTETDLLVACESAILLKQIGYFR